MSRKTFFITGTDTGVGKTFVACALLRAFAAKGNSTLGLKPVAAGCIETADGLRNDDALALIDASTLKLPYAQVNPLALVAAVAPHIAAAREEKRLRASQLTGLVRGATMQARADVTLIEGAGGWRVPLNERETFADIVRELNVPVILVVGLKLGCINHALLTAEAIRRDGLVLAGWVANCMDADMDAREENIATLRELLGRDHSGRENSGTPLLGVVPFAPTGNSETPAFDVEQLLKG